MFDNANVIRMDADTTSTKGSHEKIIDDFRNNKYIETLSRNRKIIYNLINRKRYNLIKLLFAVKGR